MTFTPSYMQYGCVSVANNAKTYAYYNWACENGMFTDPGCFFQLEDCSCPDDLICEPGPFISPVDDNACWYDPLVPESADFLGVYITKVTGVRDSTFSREVVDSVGVGSILQQPRLRGRAFAYEVMLIATSCAGMQYGSEWLRRTLEDTQQCGGDGCTSCQGREMTLRVFCPDEGQTDRGLRQWNSVGLVDGLVEIVDEENRNCCCTVTRWTFTMQSESPYSYSDTETECEIEASVALDGYCNFDFSEGICDNCITIPCSGSCENCGDDPLCQCSFIFECPPVLTDDCETCEPWRIMRSCCCIEDLPNGHDTTFTIEIDGGRAAPYTALYALKGLRNVRIRFWDKVAAFPCPETQEEVDTFTSTREPCWDLTIPYIPYEGTVRLNGKSDRVEVICNKTCQSYDRLIAAANGSVFPLVTNCSGMFMCVEFDADKTPMLGNPDTIDPAVVRLIRSRRWRN